VFCTAQGTGRNAQGAMLLGVVFLTELWGLSQKRLFQQKQQLSPAIRPSIVRNELKDMEESVLSEALFLSDYSMFRSRSYTQIKLAELWNVFVLSLF